MLIPLLVALSAARAEGGAGPARAGELARPPAVLHVSFDISCASDGVGPSRPSARGARLLVNYLLNRSGKARSYLAPDGSTRSLKHEHVALWVGTVVLLDNHPRAHATLPLTDLRGCLGAPEAGPWPVGHLAVSTTLPEPGTLAVTHFSLMDADADQPLSPLGDGAVVELGELPTRHLNIQAHTYPLSVGSVRFSLDGADVRTESVSPYALAGDAGGDFHAGTPTLGVHTLTATPFSGAEGEGEQGTPLTVRFKLGLDPRASLAITDRAILDGRFSLRRLMDFLVWRSGDASRTSLQLFQQWWDTQNPAPGLGLGPHCTDDEGTLEGFAYVCRPADGPGAVEGEGGQAFVNPFLGNEETNRDFYRPIGLFNRFDLAPVDGLHCGEYRLVYARAGAPEDTHPDGNAGVARRNLVIFEGVLPNPQPGLGLEGCRPVAEFWANLSRLDTATRAAELERFYFSGLPGFAPAADFRNFGARRGAGRHFLGQVRTNQFLQRPWLLREFRLVQECEGCAPFMVPEPVRLNPFGPLFGLADATTAHPRTRAFQDFFPSQVEALSAGSINAIGMEGSGRFNAAGSPSALNMARALPDSNYASQFEAHGAAGPFWSALQARIAPGSGLTPEHLVLRAQALSCAGCHQLNNQVDVGGGLTWPASGTFVHVSERVLEEGRFSLSPALTQEFLPHRKRVLEDFLEGRPSATQRAFQPEGSDVRQSGGRVPTLGGSTTH